MIFINLSIKINIKSITKTLFILKINKEVFINIHSLPEYLPASFEMGMPDPILSIEVGRSKFMPDDIFRHLSGYTGKSGCLSSLSIIPPDLTRIFNCNMLMIESNKLENGVSKIAYQLNEDCVALNPRFSANKEIKTLTKLLEFPNPYTLKLFGTADFKNKVIFILEFCPQILSDRGSVLSDSCVMAIQ